MIILFQNTLFLKEFLACIGCFGLFTKIKEGSGTSFWNTFSACFFHKNVPYLILYQLTKFQCHISMSYFSFSVLLEISSKMFLKVLIYTSDGVIKFKIYLRSSSKAMTVRGKNRGREKYKNLNISATKRAF